MLTLGDRQELLAHWRGPARDHLRDCLRRGDVTGFDRCLLAHVTDRTTLHFYFSPADVAGRLAAARAQHSRGVATWLGNANQILRHRFPFSDDEHLAERWQLPRDISWLKNPTGDMQFVHALNRHRFWVELAVAYRLTSQDRYATELKRQLVSWVEQNPPLANPRESGKFYPRWHLLDAAIRGDTWPWVFYLMVGTPAWTSEINTLFLQQLWQHGRFLDQLPPRGLGGNWTIMQAQGLLNIALLFPEFKESARWEQQARLALTACLNRQFMADGGHIEQSPSYHEGSLRWLAEPLYLARINGRQWARPLLPRLRRAVDCLFLMLQPDGHVPLLSDSDRTLLGYLPGLSLLLDQPQWLRFGQPGLREALMFGVRRGPVRRKKLARPTTVAFPDSGYYVMRSGDAPNAVQLVVDCGRQGGSHGHFDLLGFELTGFGKVLICDPGRLNYNLDQPDRQWIVSTPAHNTISVDGLSHERFEHGARRAFRVTAWQVARDHIGWGAQHRGYAGLPGQPVVGRELFYDRQCTVVLRDWGRSQTEHEYTISFTVPGGNVAELPGSGICTTHAHGNVLIKPRLAPGQKIRCEKIFWSPNYGQKEPAVRFTVRQTARRVRFETVIVAYAGRRPPKWALVGRPPGAK